MDFEYMAPKMVRVYDQELILRQEYFELDGKKEGEHKEYSEEGYLETISNYVNGIIHGEFRGYRPNGQLHRIGNYSNGELEGKYIRYHPNGQIDYVSNFINGDRQECKWYDVEGNLITRRIYSDGKLIKYFNSQTHLL